MPYKKKISIPLDTSTKEKNACYRAIGTPEALKLVKKEQRIDLEQIFVKKSKE